ncbi:hypothetical protein Droror1_Dr00008564, partial [Drosera rotundifolia]
MIPNLVQIFLIGFHEEREFRYCLWKGYVQKLTRRTYAHRLNMQSKPLWIETTLLCRA